MQKALCTFILLLGTSSWAMAAEPTFKLSSNCVTSVEVAHASYAPLIQLSITLTEDGATKLLNFSNNHLKEKAIFIDGFGNVLSKARIMTPVSSPFVLVAVESESKAEEIRKKLMASKGACGDVGL